MKTDVLKCQIELVFLARPSVKASSMAIPKYQPAQLLTLTATHTLTPQTAKNQRDVLNYSNKHAAILPL